jgi:hypothetical protein
MLKKKYTVFVCILFLIVSLLIIPGCKKSTDDMVHIADDQSGAVGFSPGNSAPVNKTVKKVIDMSGQSGSEDMPTESTIKRIEITVPEIVRGAKAWDMLKEASSENKEPESGYEYICARIKFGYFGEASSTTWFEEFEYLIKQAPWVAYASDGVTEYSTSANYIPPDPILRGSIYEGDTREGWVALQVPISDKTPLLSYYTESLWFKLYK